MSEDKVAVCHEAIRKATQAEAANKYLEPLITAYEKELFTAFKESVVEKEEDIKPLMVLKYHFEALQELRRLIQTDINSGKIANKYLGDLENQRG
jgi:hypothetical protein